MRNLTNPTYGPLAINAGSTYGMDTSVENNYGLGTQFRSLSTRSAADRAQRNAPSWWWLVVFLLVMAVLP